MLLFIIGNINSEVLFMYDTAYNGYPIVDKQVYDTEELVE